MTEHQVEPSSQTEPWLRGTHTDVDAVRRAVLHSLELTGEDILRWTRDLDLDALEMEPLGLPSVGSQLRHIARSIDRLMTYAGGDGLSTEQLRALKEESLHATSREESLDEFHASLGKVLQFLLRCRREDLEQPRTVGRAQLPTTLAGLLIHIAEHTQRHVGQAITTAKVVIALRAAEAS